MKPRKLVIKSEIRANENSIAALNSIKNTYNHGVNISGVMASDMYMVIDEQLEYFNKAIDILKNELSKLK